MSPPSLSYSSPLLTCPLREWGWTLWGPSPSPAGATGTYWCWWTTLVNTIPPAGAHPSESMWHSHRAPPESQSATLPEARRQAIRDKVAKMLEMGIIERSHSAWSSPIVLVPKPNGTWRFCNDFRKLNEISKYDAYPMPRIDELIECLGLAYYLSILVLTKAREKTAFTMPEGLFQYGFSRLSCSARGRLPPVPHGSSPTTPSPLCSRVHRRYWHSQPQLANPPVVLEALRRVGLTAYSAMCHVSLEEGDYLGRGTWLCETPVGQGAKHRDRTPTLNKETDENVSQSGQLLSAVQPWLCHYSSPLTLEHREKPAQPGPVDLGDRGRLLGPAAQLLRLPSPLHPGLLQTVRGTDGRLQRWPGSWPFASPGQSQAPIRLRKSQTPWTRAQLCDDWEGGPGH